MTKNNPESINSNLNFLSEAKNIAEEIIDQAIIENNSAYWVVHDHKGIPATSVNLYNGNSGIIYFFLQLYNVTKDEKYLTISIQAGNWLLDYNYSENGNLAFYCGNGGAILALMELFKLTKIERYRQFSFELVRKSTPNTNSDILYGHAGSILTLLYLHNETQETWLLQELNTHITRLINDSFIVDNGICWERNGTEIRSLCGFAHGVSGIAFVFLELYRYFGNECFYQIAELGFDYEDQYFEKKYILPNSKNNWPDFRKDTYTPENFQKLINAYLNHDEKELFDFSFMSAWCHGAPGIGLARLHAYSITKKQRHYEYLNHSIKNTSATLDKNGRNYTLCHGGLGNASLLLDCDDLTNGNKYQSILIKEAENCLREKAKNHLYISGVSKVGAEADCDLFNGKAGIGHYFLRMAAPKQTNSVVMPIIKFKSPSLPIENFNSQFLIHFFYKKLFPSLSLIVDIYELKYNRIKVTRSLVIEIVGKFISTQNDELVINAYHLDLEEMKFLDQIKSNNYLFIKNHIDGDKLNKISFDKSSLSKLFKVELQINSTIKPIQQDFRNYTRYFILQHAHAGSPVKRFNISEFTFDLLKSFEGNANLEESYKKIIKKYYRLGKGAISFRELYQQQIVSCITQKMLILSS